MMKFVSLVVTAAAMSTLAGCVAETGDTELTEQELGALACDNRDGTNAAIALVAEAMARDLGRWDILNDFETVRGNYNMMEMRLKSTTVCKPTSNNCELLRTVLSMQDATTDLQNTINGQRLNAYAFSSRLVAGVDVMRACVPGRWCPYEPHKLTVKSVGPSACGADTHLTTFTAEKATGGNLVNPANLKNALKFTEANGQNPYLQFASTATTVSIDPGDEIGDPSQAGATVTIDQIFSPKAWPNATNPVQYENVKCVLPTHEPAPKEYRMLRNNPKFPGYVYCTKIN
jgi:hypothetical protein